MSAEGWAGFITGVIATLLFLWAYRIADRFLDRIRRKSPTPKGQ